MIRGKKLVWHSYEWFWGKFRVSFWGWKISKKSKGVNLRFLTIFQPILKFRNKVRIWKIRRKKLLWHWFEWFWRKFRVNIWGWKISKKSKGVNSRFLTTFQPILKFQNQFRIWKIRPKSLVLHWFEWFWGKFRVSFWGWKISEKGKGVNSRFLTIFQPISKFRNKVRIWMIRGKKLVWHSYEWFWGKFRVSFWGWKISKKVKVIFQTIFQTISKFRNKVRIWKIRRK